MVSIPARSGQAFAAPACIDLEAHFGRKYRIEHEDDDAEDPWLAFIPCRFGHVFPYGGNRLAASTNRRGPVACKLLRLPFVQAMHDADDGVTVHFDVEHFPEVATIMQPRRRRQLSPEARDRLVAAGQANQFHGVQSYGGERQATQRGLVDV
jgi:hypothetical protein